MATDFYKNLYASEGTIGTEEVLSHIPKRVDGNMNARLIESYSREEVKEALFQMFLTKALGQMDFTRIFSETLGFVW